MKSITLKEARKINPFVCVIHNGRPLMHQDAASRLAALKDFTLEQCQVALNTEGLQKTVRLALQRRMRKLEKAS